MTSTAEDEREKSNVGPNASKKRLLRLTSVFPVPMSEVTRPLLLFRVCSRKLLGLKITVFVVLLLRSEMSPSFPIMALSSKDPRALLLLLSLVETLPSGTRYPASSLLNLLTRSAPQRCSSESDSRQEKEEEAEQPLFAASQEEATANVCHLGAFLPIWRWEKVSRG